MPPHGQRSVTPSQQTKVRLGVMNTGIASRIAPATERMFGVRYEEDAHASES